MRSICFHSTLVRRTIHAPLRSQFPRIVSSFVSRNLRFESTGDFQTGHIDIEKNEGVICFDNFFPLRLQWIHYLLPTKPEKYITPGFDPSEVFQSALPKKDLAAVTGVTPRLKDGAAFVRFSHPSGTSLPSIESAVRSYLNENGPRPFWSLQKTDARLVRGRPWIEDLYRPPTRRLRVEFDPESGDLASAPQLSQEQLYSVFRSYGKLLEIKSQPMESKELPKYALVDFATTRKAIMAKNCLHGFVFQNEETGLPLARLKISYARSAKTGWFRDWIVNHPRVVIPILIALAASIGVVIFDP